VPAWKLPDQGFWQQDPSERDAPVPVEKEKMLEEPLNPSETAPETGDQTQPSSQQVFTGQIGSSTLPDNASTNHWDAEHADLQWQPLDPSPTEGEDLASILQEEFSTPGQSHAHPGRGWSAASHSAAALNDEKPSENGVNALDQVDDLVSLAKTVFDTTFYLVPRLTNHYLLGELAHTLRQWFPKLCDRYGWELTVLSVRPDYLKWTLVDFPECLTHDALAVVRRWTSKRLFERFPELQAGNPSQDFWSPGYLVDTQNRDFPTQVLIAHVARDQGR